MADANGVIVVDPAPAGPIRVHQAVPERERRNLEDWATVENPISAKVHRVELRQP